MNMKASVLLFNKILGAVPLMLMSGALRADIQGWSVSITPANPAILEPVFARISDTQTCFIDPHTLGLHQDGSIIRITLKPIPNCIPTNPPIFQDVSLGAFGAGDFNVVVGGSDGVQFTSAHFTVGDSYSSKTGVFPLVNYSDHWWNPQESGWGMSIAQHPSDRLFAVWFVYNNSNQPTWYTLQPGQWSTTPVPSGAPTTYSGPVYKTSGPFFGVNFDPSQVGVTQVGTGTLTFNSPTTGIFSYTIEGVTGSKPISRLPF